MRRMITGNQIAKIEESNVKVNKLANNIVINDAGTQVEIGGNVVVEGIEQIGHLIDIPAVVGSVSIDRNYSKVGAQKIATGIDGPFTETGAWSEGYGPFTDIQKGEMYAFGAQLLCYWGLNAQNPRMTNSTSASLNFGTGTLIDEEYSTFVTPVPGQEDVFSPFFTEEQYEALLELIENE